MSSYKRFSNLAAELERMSQTHDELSDQTYLDVELSAKHEGYSDAYELAARWLKELIP